MDELGSFDVHRAPSSLFWGHGRYLIMAPPNKFNKVPCHYIQIDVVFAVLLALTSTVPPSLQSLFLLYV